MAGVSIPRHSTTPCGDTLTTRGTTGIGMCATTLITGVMDAIIRTITHIITIHTITHTTAQRIRRSIVLTISLVVETSILQASVATLRRAIPRLRRAIEGVAG